MTILVTGGAGYIGAHLVLTLLEAGERVTVLDDLSTGMRAAVPPEARFVQGDAGDAALLRRLLAEAPVEAIFHLAGSVVVPDSITDPLRYYRNNTLASHTLISEAVRAGVPRFIFSSTAAVYGEAGGRPVAETAPTGPINPYGASKLMTERMLRDAAAAHGFSWVIFRYFNVAGADPKGRIGQSTPDATHLIKVAVQTALGRRSHLEVFGDDYPTPDGTCLRDYIHVTDLAGAHLRGLVHLREGGTSDVFNCGYGTGHSVLEVIEAVRAASGVDFMVIRRGRRPGDSAAVVAASNRIKTRMGWTPRHADLDAIVRDALAWERKLGA